MERCTSCNAFADQEKNYRPKWTDPNDGDHSEAQQALVSRNSDKFGQVASPQGLRPQPLHRDLCRKH